jgi:hypothetical protein
VTANGAGWALLLAETSTRLEQAHNGVVDAAHAFFDGGSTADLRAAVVEHKRASQAFAEAQRLAACSCKGSGCDVCGVSNPNDAESERDWRQSGRPT